MSAESFEILCRAVCEAASATPPRLMPGANGSLAFHWKVGECVATAVHRPAASDTDVLVFVDIGPMPEDVGVRGWKALMQANLQMYGSRGARIGLSASDHLVVHVTASTADSSGAQLHDMVAGLAGWIPQLHAGLRDEEARPPDVAAALAPGNRA